MAKKTLSMSLVVAMLATSNVPVWAAEFSDGTDAAVETEAPAAETFSDDATEAPVVENTTDVTDVATATAPKLTLANWTGALAVSGDLKDGSTDVANFDYKCSRRRCQFGRARRSACRAGGRAQRRNRPFPRPPSPHRPRRTRCCSSGFRRWR